MRFEPPADTPFPRLLKPLDLAGKVTLRNRVAVSAHFAGWFADNGLPTRDYAAYIEQRAAGGLGLFIVGGTTPTWHGGPDWIHNTGDAIVPKYRMLADAAHAHGCKLFAQLLHIHDPLPGDPDERIRVGMHAGLHRPRRRKPWPPDRTAAELEAIAQSTGEAAARAVAGGADGVELHAHEGFLFAQFLSNRTNRRSDRYGGSLENRMRFMVETLQRMRTTIGDQVPLGVRLKADDCESGGVSAEEYLEVVARLEAAGLVDYFSLTAGDGGLHHGPMARPDGEWLPLIDRVKRSTGLVIMHAGRITTPQMAEAALADGSADVICLTKAHIADGDFTRKLYENRPADIRLCTRCLQQCIGQMEQMSCVYNPIVSRERTWATLNPTRRAKRVLVVGGGPAGLEAARIAADRGHEVTLWEAGERLCGTIRLAASVPSRRLWGRIADYYDHEASRRRFDVQLRKPATRQDVIAFGADAIVIATGAAPRVVPVPGTQVLTPPEVLAQPPAGARAAVVADLHGDVQALLAAEALCDVGVAVTFLEPDWHSSHRAEAMSREQMQNQLRDRGVIFLEDAAISDVRHDRVLLRDRFALEPQVVEHCDAVVISAGAVSDNALAHELSDLDTPVHVIGDADRAGGLYDATVQAHALARTL